MYLTQILFIETFLPVLRLNAYSDAFRHPIPIDPATSFRLIPPPCSEAFRHP
jgi:hypothetical protein